MVRVVRVEETGKEQMRFISLYEGAFHPKQTSDGTLELNFKAPDLFREKFSKGPDIEGTYKNCRKIKRRFRFYDTSVVLTFV